MKYKEDEEITEQVNKRTMHEKDLDRITLDHKKHKDLQKYRHMDEGY